LVVAAEGGAEGEKGRGRTCGAGGNVHSSWLLPRVSSESARARRSTKIPAPDCAECSVAVFVSSAPNYTTSAEGGYNARAVKKQLF
jgi:hypothetical protein